MSAAYTFLPWARRGIANAIAPGAVGRLRASIPVPLQYETVALDGRQGTTAAGPAVNVELYGPPDIIGINAQRSDREVSGVLSRIEPRDGVTNFEPNYLALIEFLDEDFPWRYTPAPPDNAGARLGPWLALVVLEDENECRLHRKEGTQPLDFITVEGDGGEAFPGSDTLWAWAHVHVNASVAANGVVDTNRAAVAARLDAEITRNADSASSRLVCPRRLRANTSYRACLVPAFESGRLAGLGLPLDSVTTATLPSWPAIGPAAATEFPVYFTWTFQTGATGDFETLVHLLQPRRIDASVGTRPIDVSEPHPALRGIGGATGGVLSLGGALRAPRSLMSEQERAAAEAQDRWATPYPTTFQRDLADFINLDDAYASQTAAAANAPLDALIDVAGDDPVITPPLYGRWHAMTSRLLTTRQGQAVQNAGNWVHELNLDPRHRVAAGLGARVVQDRQEDLMASAWTQIGDVLRANSRLRRMKAAQNTARIWRQKALAVHATDEPSRALMLTAPVHSRIMTVAADRPVTLRTKAASSAATAALVSPALRRIARPRARIARTLKLDVQGGSAALLERVDRGELRTVRPKTTPAGVATVAQLVEKAVGRAAPPWVARLLQLGPWTAALPIVLALVIALLLWLVGLGPAALAIVAAGGVSSAVLYQKQRAIDRAKAIGEEQQTPAAVDALPRSADFTIASPGAPRSATLSRTGADSAEAQRFKAALVDVGSLFAASAAADTAGENGPARPPLDVAAAATTMMVAIDPARTFPLRATSMLRVSERIKADMVEEGVVEAMAYPIFDTPMYRPLADISSELLIPNVNKLPNNSVTLLETNQEFVESYMVGLNYEFGRELLWREYPTDQRGSYFRQFWDVSTVLADATENVAELKERLRDIPPIHTWSLESMLGDHDARDGGANAEQLVLALRGELLKRYPNAVIYAHAAEWARDTAGRPDVSRPRTLAEFTTQEEDRPPRTKIRMPLYSAKLEPDITLLGFDLTSEQAKGGDKGADSPGWFFVVKERPGEPRFGFDETSATPRAVWSDLGWDRALDPPDKCLKPLRTPALELAPIPAGQEQSAQSAEDVAVRWDSDVSAAELAYILYQPPVRIAIHARDMLEDGRP